MKSVMQVKLQPSREQGQMLAATLRACNTVANEVATVAHERSITKGFDLRKVCYRDAQAKLGGSQAPQNTIRKVVDARKSHAANLKAGNYGKKGSARYERALAKVISFRPFAAQPYDDRILSWRHDTQVVSIWVTDTSIDADGNPTSPTPTPGRILVAFTGKHDHLAQVAAHRSGESDLVYRGPAAVRTGSKAAAADDLTDGWYLLPTIDTPDVAPQIGHGRNRATIGRETDASDWLGGDLGIVSLLYTSDGQHWSGGAVTHARKKNRHLRKHLQKKAHPPKPNESNVLDKAESSVRAKKSQSANRLLKKRSGKEARFVTNTNHIISKQIVAEAKRTGRGIALEDLSGIRDRVRLRKPQRATLHSWAFSELGEFIAYKARRAGVPVVYVDPAYTSQTCAECGHCVKQNRTGEVYTCRPGTVDRHTGKTGGCGVVAHADHNGARNIAALAPAAWRAAWDASMLQGVSHASDAA